MLAPRLPAALRLLLAGVMTVNAVDVATNYINASSTDFSPVHLTIDTANTSRRNATAPKLYGLMHEDISHSGDGGIYAELLRNRAFQGTPIAANENPVEPYGPVLSGWTAIGAAEISLTPSYPLSWALPTSMQMVIPANATGTVGVENAGWWGMNVAPGEYTFSVNVLALNNTYPQNASTTMTASLMSNTTGDTWASATIGPVHLNTFRYGEVNVTIYNNATAPDGNNTFTLTMDGEEVAGMTFFFSLFSLFPETFAGRKNGMRPDIAGPLADMQPKFLRCPGGNNLEGNSIETRFKWWQTIGPLSERPGRPGTWGYYNTEGLGLQEYLNWAEDSGAETLLAIYAGYSLDGTSYPEENMQEVLQEALDELEFCLGDTSTYWGGKRAEYGHPEPYTITYVEIGNEDFFSATYPYRFKYLYDGLKQAYPNITLISSAYDETYGKLIGNVTLPSGSLRDDHHYDQPSFFLRDGFHLYDNFQSAEATANVEVLIGEYSVFQLDTNEATNFSYPEGIHIFYPQMVSALGEAVYHLGAERNPNTVKLSCYAPQLANRNAEVWTPNMITFEAQHNRTVLSASYWWQHLFANYRGIESLPVDISSGKINPLYWASSIGEAGEVYLKVVNTGNQTVDMSFSLDSSYTRVNATAIQNNNFNAYNTVEDQTAVYPQAVNGSGLPAQTSGNSNGTWSWTVPKFSITVLQFDN